MSHTNFILEVNELLCERGLGAGMQKWGLPVLEWVEIELSEEEEDASAVALEISESA